jgi:hypothetical protein
MRVDLCRFRAFAGLLREVGHDLVIFRGGMGAKSRAAALAKASTARRSRLACISAEHPVAALRGQGMMPSWIF